MSPPNLKDIMNIKYYYPGLLKRYYPEFINLNMFLEEFGKEAEK